MPSALFEIYQKNFEKSLKRLSEALELYQKQSKEVQSITLKETELNISEMERAISQMELEVIIEKIPDNKKKLNKIIEANKNIVKQYKREIQDLKYKEQSILNKKNLAKIPSNNTKTKTELNLLKTKKNNINADDEDIALFINKNNNNAINMFNNDNLNNEISLKKDFEIKRINDYGNKLEEYNEDNVIINNTNDLDFFSNFSKDYNNINIKKKENNRNIKDIENKDSEDNKYKKNKNNYFTKILKIIINIIRFIIVQIYKGITKLKNYLHRKYGYNNAIRIMTVLAVICFVLIYTLFVIIFTPKTQIQKLRENNSDNTEPIKNNTVAFKEVKKEENETIINNNITNINVTNENNGTNISDIKGNNTVEKT